MRIGKYNFLNSGLLANTSFKQLWAGQTVSVMGSQISYIAIPLIAAELLNANALQMGLLTAASTLPFFLVGLFAGVWVDRSKRFPILIRCNMLSALILLLIPLLHWIGFLHIWQLLMISFLLATSSMTFQFAYTSVLPAIVSKQELTEGNSKLEATRATTQFVGPSIAGMLIQAVTAPVAILVDAISYLLSILFFKKVDIVEVIPERSTKTNMMAQIKSGFSYLLINPFLRTISLTTAGINFSRCMFDAVYILFVVNTLSIEAGQLGLIYGVGSIGSVIGSLFANKISNKIGTGSTIISAALIIGIGFIIASLAAGNLFVIITLLFLAQLCTSLGNSIFFITQVSVRQAVTPNQMMGRVNAAQLFISRGAIPLGVLLGGLLATWVGSRLTILIAGCLSLSVLFLLVLSPVRKFKMLG